MPPGVRDAGHHWRGGAALDISELQALGSQLEPRYCIEVRARRGWDALTGRRRRGHVIEGAVSARAVTAFDKVLGGP